MTALKFRADIMSHPQFRRLSDASGSREKAALWFLSLWVELGFLSEVSGAPGTMTGEEFSIFARSVDSANPEAIKAALIRSGFLFEKDGLFTCDQFWRTNDELGQGVWSAQKKGLLAGQYRRCAKRASKQSVRTMDALEPAAWILPDGSRISQQDMNRSLVTIRTLDSITNYRHRKASEFTTGVLHDALRVVRFHSAERLETILKRFYMVRHTTKEVPKMTEIILRNFDDLILKIMPDGGWANWAKMNPEEQRKETTGK